MQRSNKWDEWKRVMKEGLDEREQAALEKEISELCPFEKLLDTHLEDMAILNDLNEIVASIKQDFDRDRNEREPLEAVYTAKLDLLTHMAMRFHPLSDYGKKLLMEADKTRREFEEICGPLFSWITKENVQAIEDLIPEDLAEEIRFGKKAGLSMLRCEGNDIYAVGALVFSTEQVPPGKELIFRLDWLYVEEEWRKRGVADAMLAELLNFMLSVDGRALTVDFAAEEEPWGEVFAGWHFEFVPGLMPEFVLKLADLRGRKEIMPFEDAATPLSALRPDERQMLLRKAFILFGYDGFLADGLPADYLETDLSCYTGQITNPTGLLLVHRRPSGKLYIDYADCVHGKEEELKKCLGYAASIALIKYDCSTLTYMNVGSEEAGKITDELFPVQRTGVLLEGILMAPEEGILPSGEEMERGFTAELKRRGGIAR